MVEGNAKVSLVQNTAPRLRKDPGKVLGYQKHRDRSDESCYGKTENICDRLGFCDLGFDPALDGGEQTAESEQPNQPGCVWHPGIGDSAAYAAGLDLVYDRKESR